MLQVYAQKTWGSYSSLMDLYYMSSTKVVFTVRYCTPYDRENKTLVLEWPTFIDVYSFSSHLQLVIPTFEVIHAAQRLIHVSTS